MLLSLPQTRQETNEIVHYIYLLMWTCVRACVCACVRACVRACLHACVRACMRPYRPSHTDRETYRHRQARNCSDAL